MRYFQRLKLEIYNRHQSATLLQIFYLNFTQQQTIIQIDVLLLTGHDQSKTANSRLKLSLDNEGCQLLRTLLALIILDDTQQLFLSLLINFMADKLREQKYQPHYSRTREHSPQACLHQIEGTSQKLKMLINSFRERSLKDDSLGNDSEFSKPDLMPQSGSFEEEKNRTKINQRFHQLYNCPGFARDIGDTALTTRPIRHLHLINNTQVSRLIYKGHQQSPQKIKNSTKEQSLNFGHENRKISQLQSKQSQLMLSPDKRNTTFRITQKNQQRNKSLHGLPRSKHHNPEKEDEFQVQSIDAYLIVSHINSIRDLDIDSNPEEIFTFFESIYNIGRFPPPKDPVIKRYRNCIYYGERPTTDKSSPYIGMVWYYKKSLYYGKLLDGKKHSDGIEIQLSKQPMVWKGKFQKGLKTGYFCVESNEIKYYGMLKNGEYHGEGHLITTTSEYKGSFCQGIKEGRGWEKMSNKSQYKGEYFNNRFDGEGEIKAQDYYYKGMFKYGKPDGRGFQRTDLYEYLGEFVMGVKQGKGKIKIKDGPTMQCRFWNGLAVDDRLDFPKNSKQVLEPHLSKHLGSLNEQSQEGTIEHVLQAISKS